MAPRAGTERWADRNDWQTGLHGDVTARRADRWNTTQRRCHVRRRFDRAEDLSRRSRNGSGCELAVPGEVTEREEGRTALNAVGSSRDDRVFAIEGPDGTGRFGLLLRTDHTQDSRTHPAPNPFDTFRGDR